MSIPTPKEEDSGGLKRTSIPAPKNEEVISSPSDQTQAAVSELKEPSRESITTDDDWVKPSEFLKSKNKKKGKKSTIPGPKGKLSQKRTRPPPRKPDSK